VKRAFPGGSVLITLAAMVGPAAGGDKPPPVRFNTDVLPILSQNCFLCHGPDEKTRKARLRLDTRKGALAVVVPGKADDSELIRRINADEDEVMPPHKTNRRLSAEQKALLRRWVDEGAVWGKHWAYETPARPPVPSVSNPAWPRSAIDSFVLARLDREGLAPSAEAPRETLLRRVTLDLTGLPPTPAEVDAFLADRSPDAYEKVVDRLLGSPRYAERMASDWLDAARYADTNGYQNDFARTMWPWRDWVLDAFARNLPYDRFLTEQLAGDLLPGATLPQKIATGFNRNNRTVTEAGSIDEEWRVENNVDRVETTTTVFLGLTMGCARCHDHKFDPITQEEFYRFFAFFNSVNEKGVYTEQKGNVPPLVEVPTPKDRERLRQFDEAIARAEKVVREREAGVAERQRRWEKEQRARTPPEPRDWAVRFGLEGDLVCTAGDGKAGEGVYRGRTPAWADGPFGRALHLDGKAESFVEAGQAADFEGDRPFSCGAWVRPAGNGAVLSKMDDDARYRGCDLLVQNGKVEVHLVHDWPEDAIKIVTRDSLPQGAWSHVLVTYDGSARASGLRVYFDGRPVAADIHNDHLKGSLATDQPLRLGKRSTAYALKGDLADVRVYARALTAAEVGALAALPVSRALAVAEDQRSVAQRDLLAREFRAHHEAGLQEAQKALAEARKKKADFEKQVPTVMVMEDLSAPRDTFVLKRGRYDMPDKARKVGPGVPGCMTPMPAGAPANRLGLARWLVDPANPLTARVAVNRFWEHYFGTGLVKSAENFGVQGEPPSHPELLDWLATEFVRTGWDVKGVQRLLVTSATYRQSSRAPAALVHRDPENRLLARGPRFRLPAEVVRDNALAVSGLLVERLGGAPVKPYQPAGLWEELAGGAGEGPYVQEQGPGLYRRSLYTYRKRTVPHPSLSTFDAPSREVCQVKRPRTNTPLQALELLNDVTYVEASRHLAQLMLAQADSSPSQRLTLAFRRATGRAPGGAELAVLVRGLERYRKALRDDPEAARRLIHTGASPAEDTDPAELAAYTAAAGVILNLDETITKE
jgi:hypothetical protein